MSNPTHWSDEMVAILIERRAAGVTAKAISTELGVSIGAIYTKATNLQLPVIRQGTLQGGVKSPRVTLKSEAKKARLEAEAAREATRQARLAYDAGDIISLAKRRFTRQQIAALTGKPYRIINHVLDSASHDQQ